MSPLLLMGISMVAALLMIPSDILRACGGDTEAALGAEGRGRAGVGVTAPAASGAAPPGSVPRAGEVWRPLAPGPAQHRAPRRTAAAGPAAGGAAR